MPQVIPFSSTSERFPWLQVLNLGEGKAEINIRGIIGLSKIYRDWGYETAGTLMEFEEELSEIGDASHIQLNVFSRGGYVDDAVAMHDILVAHPARITGRVDGLVGSAATVLLMACSDIEMPEAARWMIHNAAGGASGDHRAMEKTASLLRKYTTDIAEMYARRIESNTDKNYATALTEVIDMMNEETWLNGRQAVEAGFVERLSAGSKSQSGSTNSGFENFRAAASADESLTNIPGIPLVYNADKIPADVRELFTGFVDIPSPEKPIAENSNSMSNPTSPAAETPAPTPAPAAAAPVAETPVAPDAETPAPAPAPAAPVAETPAPVAETPAPAAAEPTDIGAQITAAVTAAVAPLTEKITALETEQAKTAAGVTNNGWGNQAPVEDPVNGGNSSEPAPVNLDEANPFDLMKNGREALTAKAAESAAA